MVRKNESKDSVEHIKKSSGGFVPRRRHEVNPAHTSLNHKRPCFLQKLLKQKSRINIRLSTFKIETIQLNSIHSIVG